MLQRMFWGGFAGIVLTTTGVALAGSRAIAMELPQSKIVAQSTATPGDTVSNDELQKFAKAIDRFETIDQDTQEKLTQAVQTAGISPTRFLEIGESRRDGGSKLSTPVTPAEDASFKQAITNIKPILEQDQAQKERVLVSVGLTIPRFQSIGELVEKDPKLQEQLRKMLTP